MSGTFPNSPAPSTLTLKSVQPTLLSVTHSLRRQVRSRGGQRFGLTLGYTDLTRAEMAPLIAFALSQRGQFGTFQIVPAVLGYSQGNVAGAPVANGASAAGSRSVPTRGWTGSLKAGDLVKFANHSKVYMLTADAAGAAALAIEPGLFASVADGEAIVTANVPMTVSFAKDDHDWPLGSGVLMDWSLDVVEAF